MLPRGLRRKTTLRPYLFGLDVGTTSAEIFQISSYLRILRAATGEGEGEDHVFGRGRG